MSREDYFLEPSIHGPDGEEDTSPPWLNRVPSNLAIAHTLTVGVLKLLFDLVLLYRVTFVVEFVLVPIGYVVSSGRSELVRCVAGDE
jgi:hypothetical protein